MVCGPAFALIRGSPPPNERGHVKDFGFRRIWCRRIWGVLVLLLAIQSLAWSAIPSEQQLRPPITEQRELQLSATLTRASHFVDVPHTAWRWSCEQVQAPVALATPDPLLTPAGHGKSVRVSFIIGTDGHVHSPLILQSAGYAGDRHVLDTVRHWRYRPGTCNGVPTETEGKIEFSIR
jgi:TonB family protein